MTSSSSVYTGDGKDGQSLEMSPISSRNCASADEDDMDASPEVLSLINKKCRDTNASSSEEQNRDNNNTCKSSHKNSNIAKIDLNQEKNEDTFEGGINLSTKNNSLPLNCTNKRKRKSMNPIKCEPSMVGTSDDDLQDSCDDSSSGTYIGRMEDNELLHDSGKSEDDDGDDGDDDSTDEMGDRERKNEVNICMHELFFESNHRV